MNEKIDELLYASAKEETELADLNSILQKVRVAAPYPEKKPRGRTVWGVAGISLAVALLSLIAASVFTKAVEVNGKTFLAFQDRITINGVSRRLGAADENGLLLRLEDTNQYVDISESEEAPPPQLFVYAPGNSPRELKNPDAVPGRDGVPQSLAPVTVYPVVGDLVVREGPDTDYAALAVLYSGQCLTKVGVSGNWAILEWNGSVAYAFNAYLFELTEPFPEYTPVIMRASEPVNVRALPSSREGSVVLYELKTGEEVTCTGSIGEWSQIEWNGAKAYVFSQYLLEGGCTE